MSPGARELGQASNAKGSLAHPTVGHYRTGNVNGTTFAERDPMRYAEIVRVGELVGLILLLILVTWCMVCWERYQARRKARQHREMIAAAIDKRSSELEDDGGTNLLRPTGAEGVRHELGRLRLERYADSFREHGIEDWNQMLSIEEEDFKKLVAASEMPHNHADRLMESIKAERLRLNPQLSWYKEYR